MDDQNDDFSLSPANDHSRSWEDFGEALRRSDPPNLQSITWDFAFEDRYQDEEDDAVRLARQCRNVRSIVISGQLPPALANAIGFMTNLTVLDVRNSCMPEIPNRWRDLRELTDVAFGTNYIIRSLPEWISARWTRLVSLDMSRMHGLKRLPASIRDLENLKFVRHNEHFLSRVHDARHHPQALHPRIGRLSAQPVPTQMVALLGDNTQKKQVLLTSLCPQRPRPPAADGGGQYHLIYRTTEVQMLLWHHTRVNIQDFGTGSELQANLNFCPISTVYVIVLSAGDDIESVRRTIETWGRDILEARPLFVVTAEEREDEDARAVLQYARTVQIDGQDIHDRVVLASVGRDDPNLTEVLRAIANTNVNIVFHDSMFANRSAMYHTQLHRAQKNLEEHAISEQRWIDEVYNPANRLLADPERDEFEVLKSLHEGRLLLWVRVASGRNGRFVFLRPWWVAKKYALFSKRLFEPEWLALQTFLIDGLKDRDGDHWDRLRNLFRHFFATVARLPWHEGPGASLEMEFWAAFRHNQPENFEGILAQD